MAKKEANSESPEKEMSFEEALEQLEGIVHRLENEEVSLEESVNLYERGMELSKYCTETLENAEQRIEKVNEKLNDENAASSNKKEDS